MLDFNLDLGLHGDISFINFLDSWMNISGVPC